MTPAKGWLHVSGSHTLEDFAAEVAGYHFFNRAATSIWPRRHCIIR